MGHFLFEFIDDSRNRLKLHNNEAKSYLPEALDRNVEAIFFSCVKTYKNQCISKKCF